MKHTASLMGLGLLTVALIASSVVGQPLQTDSKAWIGVTVQTVDREFARQHNLDASQGAVITDVITDSPADRAGLREGDVIVRFDGREVDEAGDVVRIADRYSPGDRVSIVVVRDNDRRQLAFTFGNVDEYRSNQRSSQRGSAQRDNTRQRDNEQGTYRDPDISMRDRNQSRDRSNTMTGPIIGVRMQDLNDQLAQYFGIDRGEGVLIVEVLDNSPAKTAGIQAGDVLLSINNRRISNAVDAHRVIAGERAGSNVDIQVIRDRQPRNLTVRLTEQRDFGRQDGNVVPDPYHHPEMYGSGMNQNPDTESLRREVEELRNMVEDLQQTVDELERRGD